MVQEAVTYGRISALSRMAVCPASWETGKDQPSEKGDASCLGDAFHEALATTSGDVAEIAARHMVDEAKLRALLDNSTWNRDAAGGYEVPVMLFIPAGDGCPKIRVPGTADFVGDALVVDFKTSAHPEHTISLDRDAQLLGYAVAIADWHGLDRITAIKHFPAAKPDEQYESSEVDLPQARDRLAYIVRRAWRQSQRPASERDYRPNEIDWQTGCKGCRGLVVCEAARLAHRRAITLCGRSDLVVTRENVVEVFEAGRLARAAATASAVHNKATLELINQEGGSIPVDDSHELRAVNGAHGSQHPKICRRTT